MVTLHRGPNWKITIYARDHGVPHFHIEGAGFRCSVAIVTLEPVIGTVPAVVIRAAREWARQNQTALMSTWQELNR